MKIGLIGGIYGATGTASGYLRVTPETTLEAGLRQAGHTVTTMSHYQRADFGQFDVVHVHHLSYGALRLASDRSEAPFVFTPHDASQMSGIRLSRLRAAALRHVLACADKVVCLSRAEAEFQQSANGVEPTRVSTIPNGIDTTRFPFIRRNSRGDGRPWQLLFVGQLIPLKRCDTILRAVASLGSNVELSLVYQTADLEAELKSLAASLGIEQRVRFLGRREPNQLAELYQQSDLLVLASETEALPSVISEAMLSGLPFVSTAVGGIREQAAGFGHLVEGGSVEELAAAMRHVCDNYQDFDRLASQMSAHARNTYSIPDMVSRHLAVYEEIAGARPRRLSLCQAVPNALVRLALRRLGTRHPGARAVTASALRDQAPATERS